MKQKNINKFICILGIIFIIIGIFILIMSLLIINNLNFISNKSIVYNIEKNNIEKNNIEDNKKNIENTKGITDYKAILYIDKINLIAKIYDISSKKNDVDKNIEVINPSSFPDKTNSNLILASHSGNSNISYFKNLDKLVPLDIIDLLYHNKKYTYKLDKIYRQEKTGKVNIIRNKNNTTLTLITCDQNDKNYQVVYIAYLININNQY